MGRRKIAETSEMAHFRIDAGQKKTLITCARKLGKRENFSDLIREAIEMYIDELQEDNEIAEMRKKKEHKNLVAAYDTANKSIKKMESIVKTLGLVPKPEDYKTLDQAWGFLRNSFIQEWLTRLDKYIGPPLEKTNPGLRSICFDLLLGIVKELLIYQRKLSLWIEQTEKIEASLKLAKRHIKEIESESKTPREKK